MKRLIGLATLMVLMIMGCTTKDELISTDISVSAKSFYVKVEQTYSDTKAHLQDKKTVVFDDGDKMAVFDRNEDVSEYTYSASESKFSGTSAATGSILDNVHLLFPYSEDIKFSENCVQGTLPAVQKYYQNSFDSNSQIMYAQVQELSEESPFEMKNMCGYLMLQLYGDNIVVKNIAVSVSGQNEYISGDFYINAENENNIFALKMHSDPQTHQNLSNNVILDCSSNNYGVELGSTLADATVFYISLPPQTYSNGFTVTITDLFGREFTKTAFSNGGYEMKRNHIKPMEPLKIEFGADELLILKDSDGNYYAEIPQDSPERLLKWAYTVNHFNKALGFTLKGNITMPAKTIVEDPENKTYIFTDTDITVTDGVPSGSNWVPVCSDVSELIDGYSGSIEGKGYKIQGILVNQSTNYVGFIGLMYNNSSVTNVNFDKCYIYGKESTGVVAGRAQNGTLIRNVSVTESVITGTEKVGGIVGKNYRRATKDEIMSYVIDCSVDENSSILATGSNVGGICGKNYGASIIHCTNKADITGVENVGGIVGRNRTYHHSGSSGYVLSSSSSVEATITATNGCAGGIAGDLFHDRGGSHYDSEAYIVACHSLSTVSGNHPGSMIGYGRGDHYGHLISSFADKKLLTNLVGEKGTGLLNYGLYSSAHYSSYSEITTDIIDSMNSAIDDYNNSVSDYEGPAVTETIKCHYKWQYNQNGWPTLVEDVSAD